METPKTIHESPIGASGGAEVGPHARQSPPPRIDVRALLRGGREAVMLHGEQEYRLRITRNGKLILTK